MPQTMQLLLRVPYGIFIAPYLKFGQGSVIFGHSVQIADFIQLFH